MSVKDTGQLKKMEIQGYSDIDCKKKAGAKFTVMFNPEKYSKTYELLTGTRKGVGKSGGEIVFKGTKPQEFSFEFLIDGTGAVSEKVEVSEKVKEFLDTAYKYDGEIHKPKYLKLFWGSEITKCMFKKAQVNYTLFKPDGEPLRATINAEFSENMSDELREATDKKSSPDLTHSRIVKEGDTLAGLVYDIYQSLAPIIMVARANQLDSLRWVTPGSTLIFPPVTESE